jgi:hypothetical protein
MITVPFSFDVYAGFARCEGLLKDTGDKSIIVEFQNVDKFMGMFKSKIMVVAIPLANLTSVKFQKSLIGSSLWGGSIQIEAKDLATLKDIPKSSLARASFSIAAKDLAAAEKFVDNLHELGKNES